MKRKPADTVDERAHGVDVIATDVVRPVAPRLLSIESAATYLGLSTWTLRAFVAQGVIHTIEPPALRRRGESMRRLLFDVRDLDAVIESWKRR